MSWRGRLVAMAISSGWPFDVSQQLFLPMLYHTAHSSPPMFYLAMFSPYWESSHQREIDHLYADFLRLYRLFLEMPPVWMSSWQGVSQRKHNTKSFVKLVSFTKTTQSGLGLEPVVRGQRVIGSRRSCPMMDSEEQMAGWSPWKKHKRNCDNWVLRVINSITFGFRNVSITYATGSLTFDTSHWFEGKALTQWEVLKSCFFSELVLKTDAVRFLMI